MPEIRASRTWPASDLPDDVMPLMDAIRPLFPDIRDSESVKSLLARRDAGKLEYRRGLTWLFTVTESEDSDTRRLWKYQIEIGLEETLEDGENAFVNQVEMTQAVPVPGCPALSSIGDVCFHAYDDASIVFLRKNALVQVWYQGEFVVYKKMFDFPDIRHWEKLHDPGTAQRTLYLARKVDEWIQQARATRQE